MGVTDITDMPWMDPLRQKVPGGRAVTQAATVRPQLVRLLVESPDEQGARHVGAPAACRGASKDTRASGRAVHAGTSADGLPGSSSPVFCPLCFCAAGFG